VAHFANPLKRDVEKKGRDRCESPFEMEVCDKRIAAGYRILPQVRAGGYRIDLVVEKERQAEGWLSNAMAISITVQMYGWTSCNDKGLLSGLVGAFGDPVGFVIPWDAFVVSSKHWKNKELIPSGAWMPT
jgi:hypothetical protein